eukprot:9495071-Pyramimonas_sp.AAC.2
MAQERAQGRPNSGPRGPQGGCVWAVSGFMDPSSSSSPALPPSTLGRGCPSSTAWRTRGPPRGPESPIPPAAPQNGSPAGKKSPWGPH